MSDLGIRKCDFCGKEYAVGKETVVYPHVDAGLYTIVSANNIMIKINGERYYYSTHIFDKDFCSKKCLKDDFIRFVDEISEVKK